MSCDVECLTNYLENFKHVTLVITINEELAKQIGDTGECSISLNQHNAIGWLPSGIININGDEVIRC